MKLLKKVCTNDLSERDPHHSFVRTEKMTIDLDEPNGTIQSNGYPMQLRTNIEYQWRIHMNDSQEIEINLTDIHLDEDQDYLQILVGNREETSSSMSNLSLSL